MKTNQIDHQLNYFNKEFSQYEDYNPANWQQSYFKRISKHLRFKKGQKYLDIGCGGMAYLPIEAAKMGVRAFGVDLSPQAVSNANEFAEKQGVEKLTQFKTGNAEKLPFQNNSFDTVSSIAVLEHLVNHEKAIKEIYRILKKGGRAYITVPNAYLFMPLYTWLPYLIHDKRIGHLRHYSAKSLRKLFEANGFTTKIVLYSGHNIKFLQLILCRIFRNETLWWKLEERDVKSKSPFGVTLSMVFRKVDVLPFEPLAG